MGIIEISNLSFTYNNSAEEILNIPSLLIKESEQIFLHGPSGCGKTTFLELLAGVLVAKSGSLKIKGEELKDKSNAERDAFRAAHVGYIFQSFNLIPYLNVRDNISLPLYLSPEKRKKVSANEESKIILELCSQLGIEKLIDRNVTELSVGQQQRVAAARALIGAPELILADEPTSSLDYSHRERFINLLFKLCHDLGSSLLFVSHDQSLKTLFPKSLSLPEINKAKKMQELEQ